MAIEAAASLSDTSEACEPFAGWYRNHFREVYLQCLRYAGGDVAWAEDVAHDVFLKLLEHQHEIDDPARLGGWLYRVTANTAISHLRRRRWWVAWLVHAFQGEEPAPSAGELVDERRRGEAAMALLHQLPPLERVVLCMKLFEGKSQKEIAEVIGHSQGYVSKLMQRAVARIRGAGWEIDHG